MDAPRSKSSKLIGLSGAKDRSKRLVIQLPLHQKRFSPQFSGLLHNLTLEGAFLETIPERPGKIVDLVFSFPGLNTTYHITGRVVWCRGVREAKAELARPMGMGVKFLRFTHGTPQDLEKDLETWQALRAEDEPPAHIHLVDSVPEDTSPAEIIQIPWNFSENEINAVFEELPEDR